MHYHTFKKRALGRSIIIILLGFMIYLFMVFADHPRAVENYYSTGLYPFVCRLLRTVFNFFPFSVGDLFYVSVIIYTLYFAGKLIWLLVKKRFSQAGISFLGLVLSVQISLLVFYLFWGLNYFRLPAAKRLNLTNNVYTSAELQFVTNILIDSANNCRARLSATEMSPGNDVIYANAIKAVAGLSNTSVKFKTYHPLIKPSLLTPLLNYIGTSGYYDPFTGEAEINYNMPVFTRPFVACHEMSHQMGYGPEDEANFVGYLAAVSASDQLLRYSGYYVAVEEFMHTVHYTDTVVYKKLKAGISLKVKSDLMEERMYWLSYQNELNVITGVFYDRFLKVNNQPEGLQTYNRMVSLIMALYKKRGVINGRL